MISAQLQMEVSGPSAKLSPHTLGPQDPRGLSKGQVGPREGTPGTLGDSSLSGSILRITGHQECWQPRDRENRKLTYSPLPGPGAGLEPGVFSRAHSGVAASLLHQHLPLPPRALLCLPPDSWEPREQPSGLSETGQASSRRLVPMPYTDAMQSYLASLGTGLVGNSLRPWHSHSFLGRCWIPQDKWGQGRRGSGMTAACPGPHHPS